MGHGLIKIDYNAIPSVQYETELRLYVEHGIKPGNFLFALLNGNVLAAIAASPAEGERIQEWISFLRTKVPACIHGHSSLVTRWMSKHANTSQSVSVPTFSDFPFGRDAHAPVEATQAAA